MCFSLENCTTYLHLILQATKQSASAGFFDKLARNTATAKVAIPQE